MKVVGLITEYNPFHNGHAYHLQEAKRITGADYCIVVMSGNFVQRGVPAFLDKYNRTSMALSCGADLVLELPVCYATASAEFFALGAVSLLDKLGIVDYICFGSENGDIKSMTEVAKLLIEEPIEYKTALNDSLKSGKTFPAARMDAINAIIPEDCNTILTSPNNILGVEYIKALLKLDSNITPVTITRKTAQYHSQELTTKDGTAISSATAIRKALVEKQNLSSLKDHVPNAVYDIMHENLNKTFPITEDDFSFLLQYKLLIEDRKSLITYTDINTDLAGRILQNLKPDLTFSALALSFKSRQWTLTRINRALIHILLNLKSSQFSNYNTNGYAQYARILGMKKESSHIIRKIKEHEGIPLITKVGDAKLHLENIAYLMFKEDLFASALYNQMIFQKYNITMKDEYTKGIIII